MVKLRHWCYWLGVTLLIFGLVNYVPVFAIDSAIQPSISPYSTLSVSNNFADAAANYELDSATTNTNEKPNGKLIFSHVIYRHGDRMPISFGPTDPWRFREYWPNNWGELTNIGKIQHYHLGQWLRKRYDSLLNRTYSNDEIYIRSTDVDRTLMSALSNLAGLYPPIDNEVWNRNIPWQPIPVHTVPEKEDFALAGKATCPAYDYALSNLLSSPTFQRIYDRYEYLFNYLTKYSGLTVSSLESIQRLNNTFYIETLYNKTLPEWTKKVFPSPEMSWLSAFGFAVNTYTRQLARLKIGPLIREILHRFKAKADGKLEPDRSVWVYSAHDTTIASVLNGLKIFDINSPPYIACIMMELRLDAKNVPFVSVYYKNTTDEPYLMEIPNCGTSCPLEKMFNLYDDILPVNWKEECKLSTLMMTYEEANIGLAMGVLVVIITIMLFLSYIVMIYYRRCSYRTYYSYSQVA